MTIHHLDSVNDSLGGSLFFNLLVHEFIDKILGSLIILLDGNIQQIINQFRNMALVLINMLTK